MSTPGKRHRPTVVYHGPAAQHDMACAVLGCTEPAVLNFGSPGTFHPCWTHQDEGYSLVVPGDQSWLCRWVKAVKRWVRP